MQRDRPLQNSMIILPQTNNNINKRQSAPIQYNFPIPNIKKISNFMTSESHFSQHHNLILQQPQRQQYQSQVNVQQDNNYNNRPNDTILHQIYQKIDKLTRTVQKHEFQLSSLTIQGQFSKRVMNEVKKNLPVFTGGNDVYEHIFNLKLDIKNIQQQLSKTPKLSDLQPTIKKQLQNIQNGQKKSQNQNGTNSTSSSSNVNKPLQLDPILKQFMRTRDQFFQNVLVNMQTQISMIKKNISNINLQMKVSPIVSNSCIMLKYQQLFKGKTKNDSDMILSEYTYYIDNQGYLLDCHSRYIVDQKGKKMKLEQKHIAMLKNQKILQ